MSTSIRWVDPKPVKPKYTRPVFYPNPYALNPYLTHPLEQTGLTARLSRFILTTPKPPAQK